MTKKLARRDEVGGARFDAVALSGGCFQNRVLFEEVMGAPRAHSIHLIGRRPSPTDRLGARSCRSLRMAGRAFIPAASRGVAGLWRVNGELLRMAFAQHPVAQATLDMDATLHRDAKTRSALLLQSLQGLSAAQHLVGRAGPDRAFGVPRRQRAGGARFAGTKMDFEPEIRFAVLPSAQSEVSCLSRDNQDGERRWGRTEGRA